MTYMSVLRYIEFMSESNKNKRWFGWWGHRCLLVVWVAMTDWMTCVVSGVGNELIGKRIDNVDEGESNFVQLRKENAVYRI
jgi:hypothetical protein